MYKLQLTRVPIDQKPFCSPPNPINRTVLQEVLPCTLCMGLFCNSLVCIGPGPVPVYPRNGMNQQSWAQQNHYAEQAEAAEPSSGPSRQDRRNQRKGLREAGSPYPLHKVHDSSTTFLKRGSSVVPDMVWNDDKKTGGGKVRRTPTKRPNDD